MLSVFLTVGCILLLFSMDYFILLMFLYKNNILNKNVRKFVILSFTMGAISTALAILDDYLPSFAATLIGTNDIILPIALISLVYKNQCNFISIVLATSIFNLEDFIGATLCDFLKYSLPHPAEDSVYLGLAHSSLFYIISSMLLVVFLYFTLKLHKIGNLTCQTKDKLHVLVILLLNVFLFYIGSGYAWPNSTSGFSFAAVVWIIIAVIILNTTFISSNLLKHKNLLSEIHDKNLQIEAMNEELVALNEELKDAQDKLIQRERFASLGQMAGGLAHNLKTPIMAISGNTEMTKHLVGEYRESIRDPQVTVEDHLVIGQEMANWLNKNASLLDYMDKIISSVMNQTKGTSDTLEEEPSLLNKLIERVMIFMDYELKVNRCTLNIINHLDQETYIHGKANILIQAINNLILNAIQAYEGKEGTITIIFEKKQQTLILTVEDKGCGVPTEVQPHLFKKMITTKGKNGTGLGLYISYSAIKGYFSGEISFESYEGKGTKFMISLPL